MKDGIMRARIETSQNFELYQPIVQTNKGSDKKRTVSYNQDCGKFTTSLYSHFHYIIEPDGSLWEHGNLYLLSKFKDVSPPNLSTLESFARDLMFFRSWTLANSIDYLSSPEQKLWRPTYRIHGHLSDQVLFGEIKNSTAKPKWSLSRLNPVD